MPHRRVVCAIAAGQPAHRVGAVRVFPDRSEGRLRMLCRPPGPPGRNPGELGEDLRRVAGEEACGLTDLRKGAD